MNKEYVKQIVALKMQNKAKQNKILSATSNLGFVEEDNEKDKNTPLQIVSGYSRIKVDILDQSQGQNFVVSSNITVSDIKYAYAKTRDAMAMNMVKREEVANTESATSTLIPDTPAYTVKLMMGKAKGKTPVQAIMEGLDLNWNLNNLNINDPKYGEMNRRQANAIREAMAIPKEKLMKTADVIGKEKACKPIAIIEKKNLTRVSDKDQYGNVLTCDISVICDYSRNYPYKLEILNAYCPLIKDESGRQNVERSKAREENKAIYNMSEHDWFYFISECNDVVDMFKMLNASKAFQLANKYGWKPDSTVKDVLLRTTGAAVLKGKRIACPVLLSDGQTATLWIDNLEKQKWIGQFIDATKIREVGMHIKAKICAENLTYICPVKK